MGPIKALDSVFCNYATVRGRASRSEYWWYGLIHFVVLVIAFTVDLTAFDPDAPLIPDTISIFKITAVWILATVVPNLTVTIRRLHDSGRSGLWFFITFVPFIGGLIFFYLMLCPSNHGSNSYGPPPFGPRGSTVGSFGTDGTYKPATKSNAYAGYALLAQENGPKSAEHIAAQRAEVSDYYRTHVLGQSA